MKHPPILLGRARGSQGDLQLALEGGQRCAQLVGRVGGETARLGEGGFEPGQHGVESVSQVVDLVVGAPTLEPPAQILGRDLARRLRHHAHW